MITLIKPEDLSYEDYLIEKEKNPLFFWKHKATGQWYKCGGWSWNNVFSFGGTGTTWSYNTL